MGTRGGARPGAGRPTKEKQYGTECAAAEAKIKVWLPDLLDKLFKLANGGQELVQEEWQPAGVIMIGQGDSARLAYPKEAEETPDKLMLVRRTVAIAGMDRASLTYLIDRVLGRTVQRNEISGLNGDPLEIVVTHARYQADNS